MVYHRVQPGAPAISYKLIATITNMYWLGYLLAFLFPCRSAAFTDDNPALPKASQNPASRNPFR